LPAIKDNQPVPLSKLAEELDISPVSVNEMCRKLQENGLINYQPYKGASLTPRDQKKPVLFFGVTICGKFFWWTN
jgi:Mn-dependent DtxR family transcriptional regulator